MCIINLLFLILTNFIFIIDKFDYYINKCYLSSNKVTDTKALSIIFRIFLTDKNNCISYCSKEIIDNIATSLLRSLMTIYTLMLKALAIATVFLHNVAYKKVKGIEDKKQKYNFAFDCETVR